MTERFVLDPFQVAAIAAIDAGQSVLVAAPTGSGKTLVAEHAVAEAFRRGEKAFYTAPIKALSNQKFADLVAIHGSEQVGLLTGDNVVNGDAPIVVMTTEVLRNMIYAASPVLTGLSVVVLDEVHYLQDPYRGPVWEEVIIHAPAHVKLVCLSATVSNAAELTSWITDVRGPTTAVVEERRPVELLNLYAAHDRATRQLLLIPTLLDGRPNHQGERMDADSLKPARGGPQGRARRRYATPRRVELVDTLAAQGLLPAIDFVFSRAGCDEAAAGLLDAGVRLTDEAERSQIREIADEHTAGLTPSDLAVLGHDRWRRALEHGVAAHHAGMVPAFKEAVEACFVEGLVKVVFATETLALGINMPARSVVIEALSKFTGDRHEMLTAGEYTQLTGRAGRRGIDELGRAILLWSPFTPFDQVAALAMSRDFVLTSSFRPTYNMTANLIRRYDRDGARRLLNQSFAQFQADRSIVKLETRRAARKVRLAESLETAQCERGSVDEYYELVRSEARSSKPADAVMVARSVAHLRPGDVITFEHRPVAVIAVAHRGGSHVRLHLLDSKARVHKVADDELPEPPTRIGKLSLPRSFDPGNRGFRADTARALQRAQLSTPAPTRRQAKAQRLAEGHPVARCPDRDRHLKAAALRERLEREIDDLDQRIESSSGSVARRFDAVLGLLERWQFVDGWALTTKGRLLVRTYHECDLLVAEALSRGVFDGLDAASLAAALSCVTYEHRSRIPPPPPWFPTAAVRVAHEQLERIAVDLRTAERRAQLPETRMPDPTFVPLAHAWAAGGDLGDILDEDLSGGDFVRNIRQLIDLLRQVGDIAPVPATRSAAAQAIDRLFRGVIAASSILTASELDDDRVDDGGELAR